MDNRFRQRMIILSPFGVILVGYMTARVAGSVLDVWAWVPLTLVFWSTIAFLIRWGNSKEAIKRWLQRPKGAWGWSILALAVGILPLPIFLMNWQLLKPVWIWLLWVIFALVNPWLEEGYWRGSLTDATSHWPGWVSVLYSSVVYAISHPLMWGVHSVANRTVEVVVSTFTMGVVWAIVYRKSGSLRWPIIAHILVDIFNLSVAAFMNVFIPPGFS